MLAVVQSRENQLLYKSGTVATVCSESFTAPRGIVFGMNKGFTYDSSEPPRKNGSNSSKNTS